MDQQENPEIKLEKVHAVEFIFQKIKVIADTQIEVTDEKGQTFKQPIQKQILKTCSGKFSPNTFTAIVGPSGCGKTTMLNLLSGRMTSTNLSLSGNIFVNGSAVKNILDYKDFIGYVMQDDLMLATFTPYETFRFVADMRLPHKSDEEKDEIIEQIIESLGLSKCADTYVGNNMIKGLSGGERKRTSIGMELLTNPSIIFLDQPTTGLDSTTALNVIRFLNKLAAAGRTIISTIHQPSSEIFQQFDKLVLMVDGNVIYNGNAQNSIPYFAKLNMGVPLHSNPIDHYMKLMNKEGISLHYIQIGKQFTDEQVLAEFKEKVDLLVKTYKSQETLPQIQCKNEDKMHNQSASWCTEFGLVASRAITNELRNPIGLRAKFGQVIFFAIMTIILYERAADSLGPHIQNVQGTCFFFTMNVAFMGIFSTLTVFNLERPVFIRQRLSNTYCTSSYYFGRSVAYLPLEIILPLLLIAIPYFAVNLNDTAGSFFYTYLAAVLVSWMSSSYGLLLSVSFSDAEVAMGLVPILIIPFMLVGGFFAPLQNVHDFYKVFQYLSMFKYGYQTMIEAQYYNGLQFDGIQYKPLEQNYQFQEPAWLSYMLLGLIGLALRLISLLIMYLISNPKSIKLEPEPSEIQRSEIAVK